MDPSHPFRKHLVEINCMDIQINNLPYIQKTDALMTPVKFTPIVEITDFTIQQETI